MIRIGYAPGAYDLFHIGHLNLLRRAKAQCDYLIAGVVSDEVLAKHKGAIPVVPLEERLEIVRSISFVDVAQPAMTHDKLEIWRDLRFNVLFKGDDWRGTEKGDELEREFGAIGVEVIYFPYTRSTSSSALRNTLRIRGGLANNAAATVGIRDGVRVMPFPLQSEGAPYVNAQ